MQLRNCIFMQMNNYSFCASCGPPADAGAYKPGVPFSDVVNSCSTSLIAMAGEGLDPPHAAALARGLQLAQDQAGGIRKAVMRLA